MNIQMPDYELLKELNAALPDSVKADYKLTHTRYLIGFKYQVTSVIKAISIWSDIAVHPSALSNVDIKELADYLADCVARAYSLANNGKDSPRKLALEKLDYLIGYGPFRDHIEIGTSKYKPFAH